MKSDRFRELCKSAPDNDLFRFSLGQALIDEGKSEEAIPHLEFCAEKRADWMVARILLGRAWMSMGKHAKARPILEEALHLAIEQEHETPEAEIRDLLVEVGDDSPRT